jgi:hypothetical protein
MPEGLPPDANPLGRLGAPGATAPRGMGGSAGCRRSVRSGAWDPSGSVPESLPPGTDPVGKPATALRDMAAASGWVSGAWAFATALLDMAAASGCISGAWGPSGPVPEGKPAGAFAATAGSPDFPAAAHRFAALAAAMASFHGAWASARARSVARSSARLNPPECRGGGSSAGGMGPSWMNRSNGRRASAATAIRPRRRTLWT